MNVNDLITFGDKLRLGHVCLGSCITFSDPTVTEALADVLDFVWIDMEHNPLSLGEVQGHILATKATGATALVRVPWNDPVLIKPVLDIGAAGVIVPLVRTAEDIRRAVAACKYPPDGIRGYGPRRPSNYGRRGGPSFIQEANASILTIAQIEHAEAVNNLDEILAVAGLATIVIGPNDLAGSLGHPGEPRHPEVLHAIDIILAKAQRANIPAGLASGGEPGELIDWIKKGVRWLSIGSDFWLLVRTIAQLVEPVRKQVQAK
jgi:2-keto-3-deoxy-L-rhamnonate aldolase RhmA